jgi:hypothetical protein
MFYFLTQAISLGAVCSIDGCILTAVAASASMQFRPWQTASIVGVGHLVFILLGIFLSTALKALWSPILAMATILSTAFIVWNVLKPLTKKHGSGCACCKSKSLPITAVAIVALMLQLSTDAFTLGPLGASILLGRTPMETLLFSLTTALVVAAITWIIASGLQSILIKFPIRKSYFEPIGRVALAGLLVWFVAESSMLW